MLDLQHLSVAYGAHLILNDLNLSLETGRIHGLVGLNGSGKTTLLNTMFGFVKPKRGQLLLDGEPLRRDQIAYVETEMYFYPNLSGREWLGLFKSDAAFDVAGWERLLQIPLDELTLQYSTGMRRKLAILGALRQNRPLILLDEPFNGLDLESVLILQEIAKRLRSQRKTLVVTSHVLETLVPICDQIHHLEQGQIKATFERDAFERLGEALRTQVVESTREALDRLL
jgi:ABC-2 type transport system ATP-binding protein